MEEIYADLRRWPRNVLSDHRAVARESVEQARAMFGASRVVLAFEDSDEPWVVVASTDGDGFQWREEEDLEPLVDPSLEEQTFCDGSAERVHPRLRAQLGEGVILSCPIRSENIHGRLFVARPDVPSPSLLMLGEAVSALVASRFEATTHAAAAAREAVERDRLRVARDLHDGLLQSFTGVVLQLETIHSTLESRPEEARRMITATQGLIMADQRELRRFVEELRPRPASHEPTFDFSERLEDLRARFETQWGVRLEFDVRDIDPLVSGYIGHETFRLIHEAVTNSAKHGRASIIRVSVRTAGSDMHIEVADDGTGFPFHGRLTGQQVVESGQGPMVLAERVMSLNGMMTVDSTESGATVAISIPLGWGGP